MGQRHNFSWTFSTLTLDTGIKSQSGQMGASTCVSLSKTLDAICHLPNTVISELRQKLCQTHHATNLLWPPLSRTKLKVKQQLINIMSIHFVYYEQAAVYPMWLWCERWGIKISIHIHTIRHFQFWIKLPCMFYFFFKFKGESEQPENPKHAQK